MDSRKGNDPLCGEVISLLEYRRSKQSPIRYSLEILYEESQCVVFPSAETLAPTRHDKIQLVRALLGIAKTLKQQVEDADSKQPA